MRTMSGSPCLHYDCSNRNSFGYCKTTVCINEHYQQEQWGLPSTKNKTESVVIKQPSAQPNPTLYGYPIEHLAMIARVMAKENCTPEVVAQMLQNAGEIAKMVRDEMIEMLEESVKRSCKGGANEQKIEC